MVFALLLAIVIPATALGQGRGRGYGRGGIFGNPRNKCAVFVNCHDARDGRVDGRGPRGDRVGYTVLRSRRYRMRNRPVGRRFWLQRRASLRNRNHVNR